MLGLPMFALMRKRLRGRGKDQRNKNPQQDNNSFHKTKFFLRSTLYICRLASMLCSSVSPEAPLMVQATIIFLFRICLGGLINLLRIHNSIYQNNGILPFSLLVKAMRRELCWDSDIFDQCEKDDFYLFDTCHRKDVSWGLKSDQHSALLGSQHSVCFLSSH